MNFIDKIILSVAPELGLKRLQARSKVRAYEAATTGRRGDGWARTGGQHQNADIQRSLPILRERSVDGYKNNSNVFSAIRKIQNNTIGTGIMPTPIPKPGDKPLTTLEKNRIKQAWELFVEACDFDGSFNFYGMQTLGMRTAAMQGECFVMRHRDKNIKPVPFEVQILAPYMVDHNKSSLISTRGEGNYVIQGVEFNSRGKKVGYWMHKYNPNNEFVIKLAPEFVSVDDVLQIFYKEYPEQVRGVPFGTASMFSMKNIDQTEDAALENFKIAACHVMVTTRPQPLDEANTEDGFVSDMIDRMEPGMIQYMAPGEEVTFNNPSTPAGFSEFITKNQQKAAAGYGITYEAMTGDMSNTNFSSGRMGWIEFQRQIEDWQYNFFIPQFCKGVWKWFIEGLIIQGIITREVWADWTPPAREMLDPVKEMNGLVIELSSGLVSWDEACKRRGYNPDLLFEQIKADKKRFEDAGINVEWLMDKAATAATAEPTDPQAQTEGMSTEDLVRVVNLYGVGVRAGAITPIQNDEEHFRKLGGLPEMTPAVEQAWKDAGGFRTPITLKVEETPTQDGGAEVPPPATE